MSAKRRQITIIVGETGNEIGHVETCHVTDAGIRRAMRRRVAAYDGDGWAIARDAAGREIDRIGRFGF